MTKQEKPIKQSFYYKSFICKINFSRSTSRSFPRSRLRSKSGQGQDLIQGHPQGQGQILGEDHVQGHGRGQCLCL